MTDVGTATEAGVIQTSHNSIQDWEKGLYCPGEESFNKIAAATGVEQSAWMSWWNERPNPTDFGGHR